MMDLNLTANVSLTIEHPSTLIFAYSLFLIYAMSLAVVGNIITFIGIWRFNSERSNICAFSVLFADLFIGVLMLPIELLKYNFPALYYDKTACYTVIGLESLGLLVLILHLAMENILGYIELMCPFWMQGSSGRRLYGILAAVSWGLPTTVTVVCVASIVGADAKLHIPSVCSWKLVPQWYPTLLFYGLYVPSTATMLLSCILIMSVSLKKSKQIENLERSVRSRTEGLRQASRLKQIRVLIILVLLFVVMWLPVTILMVFFSDSALTRNSIWYPLFPSCLSLTALLPALYYSTIPEVRSRQLEVLRSCFFLRKLLRD